MTAHPDSISGWRSIHAALRRCPACGEWRLPGATAHQERWEERDGRLVLIDCAGRVLCEVTP